MEIPFIRTWIVIEYLLELPVDWHLLDRLFEPFLVLLLHVLEFGLVCRSEQLEQIKFWITIEISIGTIDWNSENLLIHFFIRSKRKLLRKTLRKLKTHNSRTQLTKIFSMIYRQSEGPDGPRSNPSFSSRIFLARISPTADIGFLCLSDVYS